MSNSNTIAEFLVEIGYLVKGQEKIQSVVKNTEKELTATTEAGAAARVAADKAGHQGRIDTAKQASAQVTRVHANETARQSLISDDAAKRDRIRRAEAVKQMEGFALRASSFASGLASGLTGVLSAVPLGGFVTQVKQAADDFNQLQLQARRTGSTPLGLLKYKFAFQQAGVSAGEANASIENFSGRLRSAPEAYLGLLRQFGVKTTDDRGNTLTSEQLMENLGQGLANMPLNLAQRRGEQLGLGVNTVNALRDQQTLQEQIARADEKFKTFGFDPNKAADDARKFDQSYNNLAANLKIVGEKLEAEFFGPLTTGFDKISAWMERNPEEVETFSKGMLALSALMAARVIPIVASLTLRMTGLSAAFNALPRALLSILGIGTAATVGIAAGALVGSTTSANAGEPQVGPDGTLTYPDGHTEKGRVWDGHSGAQAPPDTRNWWQRVAPKWAGGQDSPMVAHGMHGASLRDRRGSIDDNVYPTGPIDADSLNWGSMSKDRAAKRLVLARYAKSLGLSDAGAAGMVGHAEVESNFKTDAHNGRLEDSTGLFQLNDSAAAGHRHSKYLAWAQEHNRVATDWKSQMDYAKNEAQRLPGPNGGSLWDAMQKAGSVAEANRLWMDHFENPKFKDYSNRESYGDKAYAALKAHPEPTFVSPLPHPLSKPVVVELSDRSTAHLGDRVRGAVGARSSAFGSRVDAAIEAGDAEDRRHALHQHIVELAKQGKLNANYLLHRGHNPIHLGSSSVINHGDRVFNRSGDTFHVTGSNVAQNLDAAQRLSARRASEDRVRFMEGSQQ